MSLLVRLSCRYLLKYPQRSLSMITSIFLSVFLIVAIGSLSISVRNANVIACKNDNGPQHVIYRDRNFNLHNIKVLQSSPQIKNCSTLFYYGGWMTPNGLTVNLLAADSKILYMNNTRMQAGRFPTRSHELALEPWVLDRLHLPHKLGQTLPVEVRKDGKIINCKLVGIIANRTAAEASGQLEAYLAFNQENLQERYTHNNALNLLVEFQDGVKINQAIKQTSRQLGLKVSKETVIPNRSLLSALGQMDTVDWYLVSVALMLMLVGGMVIFSIYSISVLKRVHDYGMLRAIGASSSQIILIIMVEVAVIYLIGTLLGIFAGSLWVQLFKGATTSMFIPSAIEADNLNLDVIMVSPFAIKLSLLVALGSILAAAIRAARMAMKVSPIAAINRVTQDDSISFTNSCLEGLVSIPRRISVKNLKRNKKALVFITIAMSIGCTLFMVESFKAELFDRSADNYHSVSSFWADDFCLNANEATPMARGYSAAQIYQLRHMTPVKKVKAMQVLYSRLKLSPDRLNGVYGERYIKYMNRGEANYTWDQRTVFHPNNQQRFALMDGGELVMRNTVIGMSKQDLAAIERVLLSGKHRIAAKSGLPRAIVYIPQVNIHGTLEETKGQKMQPVLDIQGGDHITLTFPGKGYQRLADNASLIYDYRDHKSDYVDQEFEVAGIITTLPEEDNTHLGNNYGPYLFVSENDLQRLTGIKNYRIVSINLKDPDNNTDYSLVKSRVQYLADLLPGTFVSDKIEYHRENKRDHQQYMLLMGAIALILITIGGLSIYTNIYYDLISRQREFGIMRAIGLTRSQFHSMIHFEGLLYGAMAALVSCIIAFVIDYGTMAYYLHILHDPHIPKAFFIEWKSILIVVVVNLAVGYMATLNPARLFNKTDISEAIRTIE